MRETETTPKEKPRKKCTPGHYCQTLQDRLQAGSYGRGLRVCIVLNMKTGHERLLVIYKKDPKDKGLILNLCPWCGGKLHKDKS